MKLLSAYEVWARLAPGLFALAPVAVLITALGFRGAPVLAVAISLLSVISGPILIASVVRRMGLRSQAELWKSWGGPPTTRLLRTRDAAPNAVQRDVWREAVTVTTKIPLLSARAEKANPAKADQTIATAVANLRTMTKTDAFPMIAAENRNYGFERNLYGSRKAGRVIAVLVIVALAAALGWRAADSLHPIVPVPYILGLVLDALFVAGWFVLPSAERAKTVSEQYAHQLLQGAVTLAADSPAQGSEGR
jgi:hypothetical protein